MNDPEPFTLAVVGDADGMHPAQLGYWLDVLLSRQTADGRPVVVVAEAGAPAVGWARERGHEVTHPVGDHPVKALCDIVTAADAVVCAGDPEPYRLLMWLCDQAGIPFRIVRRPRPRVTNLPD